MTKKADKLNDAKTHQCHQEIPTEITSFLSILCWMNLEYNKLIMYCIYVCITGRLGKAVNILSKEHVMWRMVKKKLQIWIRTMT